MVVFNSDKLQGGPMGYNTSVTGEITFSPVMKWAEIRQSRFNVPDPWKSDMLVRLEVAAETIETDDGESTARTSAALIPAIEDPMKAYALVEQVQDFIDKHGQGRKFYGYLECEGEEQPDMWRVYVRDGRAVTERAAILWREDLADVAQAIGDADSHLTLLTATRQLLAHLNETFNKQDRH
jgi:hypothetical protein